MRACDLYVFGGNSGISLSPLKLKMLSLLSHLESLPPWYRGNVALCTGFWTVTVVNCDALCVLDWGGGMNRVFGNSVGVRGCENDCPRLRELELYMESLRGGTGGGWSWSVLGGSTGGSGDPGLMNTSLLALLDVESLLFVFLRLGGNGGGCNGGMSDSWSRDTNSAVGTLCVLDETVVQVPETWQIQFHASICLSYIRYNLCCWQNQKLHFVQLNYICKFLFRLSYLNIITANKNQCITFIQTNVVKWKITEK